MKRPAKAGLFCFFGYRRIWTPILFMSPSGWKALVGVRLFELDLPQLGPTI
jgi:hypothetical protein